MRLDLFLVKTKKAASRTQAQDLIDNEYVILKKSNQLSVLKKSSFDVTEELEAFISVLENPIQKYVSRGGLKLEAALREIHLDVTNKKVLDIGQSTGGFTDCLLQKGAALVVGIDVGHDQLSNVIKKDARVISFQGLHAKDLEQTEAFQKSIPSAGFDLIVVDVSFISLTKVTFFLKPLLAKQGHYLFLVKPQFESGADALDKNGIVKDEKVYALIQNQIMQNAEQVFGSVIKYFKSELPGKDGNREFFIYGQKQS